MKESFVKVISGWLASLCIAAIIVFIIKTFIGIPTTVKGSSMANTLQQNDKLFLSTWGANFSTMPKRGDIITFEAPSVILISDDTNYTAIYKKDSRSLWDKILYYTLGISNSSYIKRVIGLPGEHIEIKNDCVYIDGKVFMESYIENGVKTNMNAGGICDDFIVPDNCVFVLGDNRGSSVDSRKFGCIPVSKIEGKVIAKWWPIN